MNYLWDTPGYLNIAEYFNENIRQKKLHHSYIFYGHVGTDKLSFAECLAKIILCQQKDTSSPCGKCDSCLKIKGNNHPDFHKLEREQDEETNASKKNISIQQILALQSLISRHSFYRGYKVIIITETDKLSLKAANSLLKILEEPYPRTVFIHISENINSVLKTIISRSHLIYFTPLSHNIIENFLKSVGCPEKKIKEIASLSMGSAERAKRFLTDDEYLENYKKTANILIDLIKSPIYKRILVIEKLFSKKILSREDHADEVISNWISVLRDILLIKKAGGQMVKNSFIQEDLNTIAKVFPEKFIVGILENILKIKNGVSKNLNIKIALENLMIQI